MTTQPTNPTPAKKSSPKEIAQRSLDAAQKRVDKATQDIAKAEQSLAEAKAEKPAAEAIRDYRKGHPALAKPDQGKVLGVSGSGAPGGTTVNDGRTS